jgi:hypothetical protein
VNRRNFLAISGVAGAGHILHAQCGPMGCRAQINFPSVALAATLQNCPEWCWAASISMVFKFFGHPVAQERIVMQTYGQLACWPAFQYQIVSANLNKCWTDDLGSTFRSTLSAAYDAQAGVFAINNAMIINELLNQRPLLYGNTHHAMVIVGANYAPGPAGPVINEVDVMDPWPLNPRLHPLSPAEMFPVQSGGRMAYLASIEVSPC